MEIPLEMLIDYMSYLNPILRLKNRDIWISGIKMMPEDGKINPNYTYFAAMTDELSCPEGAPLVVTCQKHLEPRDDLDNCIILHTDIPVTVIFNEMLGLQNLILAWGQEVELSLSREEGLQRLLDLSGRVFGNPIAVINTSFKTIGATWEYETEDTAFWELLELGYLTKGTLTRLQDLGYFRHSNLSGDHIIIEPNELIGSTSIMTAINHDNSVVFIVLMLCSNSKNSRGLMQLYSIFIDKLKIYLEPAAARGDYLKNQFDYFILDIVEGRLETVREITERSLVFPPAFTMEYFCILISHKNSSGMYLEHAMNNLAAVFPNTRHILHGEKIILLPEVAGSQSRRENFLSTLSGYLAGSEAEAGISEPAVGLMSIKESYRQAESALSLGKKLRHKTIVQGIIDKKRSDEMYYFRDYHVYNMLSGREAEPGVVARIQKYDLEHKTDYYRILFVFLSFERSFTKSAELLKMHRNNVIYHIKRIKEIFELDLDDPSQRLRLLMLYRLSDLL